MKNNGRSKFVAAGVLKSCDGKKASSQRTGMNRFLQQIEKSESRPLSGRHTSGSDMNLFVQQIEKSESRPLLGYTSRPLSGRYTSGPESSIFRPL